MGGLVSRLPAPLFREEASLDLGLDAAGPQLLIPARRQPGRDQRLLRPLLAQQLAGQSSPGRILIRSHLQAGLARVHYFCTAHLPACPLQLQGGHDQ